MHVLTGRTLTTPWVPVHWGTEQEMEQVKFWLQVYRLRWMFTIMTAEEVLA